MRPWTWEELAAATLPRQFPHVAGAGSAAVVELFRQVGPVQSQAARAPFLSAAARLPGASYADIRAAHESLRVVRSTSLRGTVHTSTAEQHAALAVLAQETLLPAVRRLLKLTSEQVLGLRAALEELTQSQWVDHDRLLRGAVEWFRAHDLPQSIAALDGTGPRYSLRGHPAMLRRPGSATAGWDSQAAVVYRAAVHAIAEQQPQPGSALRQLVRHQVGACGPVSRRDLAWWSGAGLRQIDATLAELAGELVSRPGPNGLEYHDLAEPAAGGVADPGVRLIPEYDALLLGYDPLARDRFADEAAHAHSWNRANGVHSATVLADGRLRGKWQLERRGQEATIAVQMFPGERPLDPGELTAQATAVGAALGLTVIDVTVSRVAA